MTAGDDDDREIRLTPEVERLRGAIQEFMLAARAIYGLYWDAWIGFSSNVKMLNEAQAQTRRHVPPGTDVDALLFYIGKEDPSKGGTPDHVSTQGEFKTRNARGGENDTRLAQMTLVFLYETWDGEHRRRFAEALGCPIEDIKIPALGDLRLLRNAILHERGIVSEKIHRRLEVLKVGGVGSRVTMDDVQMRVVVQSMMDSISEWVFAKFGIPRHGGVSEGDVT